MNGSLSRKEALAIWQAGVDAVASDVLVRRFVNVDGDQLRIGRHHWPLTQLGRIEVVGAGKAGAGMVAGLEQALGPRIMRQKQVSGWVNVPADCVRPSSPIQLHAARPAGRNEPTEDGVVGAQEILRRVRSLKSNDLCICLISGGGSALLPAPCDGISLGDLLSVTQKMSAAGATIQQLNTVRQQLSQVQAGRLAQNCRAGDLVALIISDVIGDPLELIASGPTVIQRDEIAAARRALAVIHEFSRRGTTFPQSVRQHLEQIPSADPPAPLVTRVLNLIIGNNDTAVEAAQREATRRGYRTEVASRAADDLSAEDLGRALVNAVIAQGANIKHDEFRCRVGGGEPVVTLVDANRRGRGGRNQQLVLAALVELLESAAHGWAWGDLVLLSGGTDGEDGPTDAAGALLDRSVWERMTEQHLEASDFLRRNDAYSFFDETGGLIRTGPTHTNVCDLHVTLTQPHRP